MPPGIRYMSDARDYIQSQLPYNGKYILDKTLTGCGGTEMFLTSGRPLVLISPRSGLLINKYRQHPECHLFRDSNKSKLPDLKQRLKNYLYTRPTMMTLTGTLPPVILTTLDSAKYVIEELEYQKTTNSFLFLVDEFQNLIGDSVYKGKTELEFLKMLDGYAKNICYMSATPIQDLYLDALPEFQNIGYYELQWDPAVIVEPTVNEILMKKGETPVTIVSEIINEFKRVGYFAKKIKNGKECLSKEAVFFINEVKTIIKIIKTNKLNPHDVKILISESSSAIEELKKAHFEIGEKTVDRNNPCNKTFTFCSKASFEGRDFYSDNAFTFIFLDGTKDWQIHDSSIEIPQMLGRQRLDENPFKYNAIIYYRTKPTVESESEFMGKLKEKLEYSESLLRAYNNGDPMLQKALANSIDNKDPNNRYISNYLDVIHDASGYRLEINFLVAAAEHSLWSNKAYYYNNPLHLTNAIQSQMSTVGTKPSELRDFEIKFYATSDERDRMRLYCQFRSTFTCHTEALYQNPFIGSEYHAAYDLLGPAKLNQMNFDMSMMREEMIKDQISDLCQTSFIEGKVYRAEEVKTTLQRIYDSLGYSRKATAVQINEYITVKVSNKRLSNGTRQQVYMVI